MTLPYLSAHVASANQALALAQRQAAHLRYSSATLFAQGIDQAWVERLPERPEQAEKIEAFVGRFGRFQDHLGDKLLPVFARLLGHESRALIDVLNFAERMGWLASAEDFVGARKLRNLLVHEYQVDALLLLEALQAAQAATEMLLQTLQQIEREAQARGLRSGAF